MKISILDHLIVRPGRRDELLNGFRANYLPAARARGLTLAGIYVVPPLELDGVPSEVTIVWTVPDYRAYFSMRGQAGADPSVAAFWAWCEALVERREHHVGAVLNGADGDTAKEPAP
jgi:hypothetical protein